MEYHSTASNQIKFLQRRDVLDKRSWMVMGDVEWKSNCSIKVVFAEPLIWSHCCIYDY